MDFTQHAVSFSTQRPYLAFVDHVQPASLIPHPILNHDLVPGSTYGRWWPSAMWKEWMTGTESCLFKIMEQAHAFMSFLCQAEVVPSDQHAASFIRHDMWRKALGLIDRGFIEEPE